MNSKMMKVFIGIAAVITIFVMFAPANAQNRREVRGKQMTKGQVKAIIDRVEDRLDNFVDNPWADSREEVRKCLNIASDIDGSVKNRRFGSVTEANWSRVRYELNSLADVYNMPKVGAAAYRN